MAKVQIDESQAQLSELWNEMIPPPDGQVVINRLGTVCMSYNTLNQLGLAYKGADLDVLERWLKENGKSK